MLDFLTWLLGPIITATQWLEAHPVWLLVIAVFWGVLIGITHLLTDRWLPRRLSDSAELALETLLWAGAIPLFLLLGDYFVRNFDRLF